MENYYKKIEKRFIMAAIGTNDNARQGDVNRNHVNYGYCKLKKQPTRSFISRLPEPRQYAVNSRYGVTVRIKEHLFNLPDLLLLVHVHHPNHF